ncbi:hypothetical protein ILUMI_16269 [Ignelater luminosus]|uniref:DDE-1 domain-containing protein n=1 Tax=Ignelater luminosus TaxID=2038154 RepID=A0A8K0G8D1_IGNLU|nr:hypothetical protein ILUMI_16269 [Ignelater luminosus]
MPRNRIRTTAHRSYSDDQLLSAVKQVSEENKSARYVAKVTGIPRATLNRHIIKIFTTKQETLLANYIKHAYSIHFGLSTKASRRLAFEFVDANNVISDSWKSNKMAGKDRLYSFMIRHTLLLSTQEQTSLSRATSFNKHNVILFFNNLKEVKEKFGFSPQDIYNLDESTCTTVHKPPTVLARRGQKIGTLVTFVAIASATGKAIPPFSIFPRALNFAKENGIILLTLPPHCSHKLQPLDVAVFRSFKKFYNIACATWTINNPGKPITIYSIAGLVDDAFPKSITPLNICNGFKKTGIEPFNSGIFTEEDFLSAFVTDRSASPNQPTASTSWNLDKKLSPPRLPLVVDTIVSPDEICPHPKAPPRKGTRNIKKNGQLS